MATYELSLGRWHKVAKRLQDEMNDLSKQIRDLGKHQLSLTAHATTGPEVIEGLRSEIEEKLERHGRMTAAWAMIRASLARANVDAGVSDRLALVEAMKAQAGVLRELHAAESSKQHGFDDYKDAAPVPGTTDAFGRTSGGMTAMAVRLFGKPAVDGFMTEFQRLSRQIEKKGDEINDINGRTTLKLELLDEVAQVAAVDHD